MLTYHYVSQLRLSGLTKSNTNIKEY
ncbi:hypothetical protein Zm00014a_022616 [Zea mays]|uniref:Uncharacterized protein n=1 Tax=Zea mays TaxID=4577 RepID=A0A3L6FE60_MAIZE|nr:hypothetical protein Zm00014a_022616 [Zea mays]